MVDVDFAAGRFMHADGGSVFPGLLGGVFWSESSGISFSFFSAGSALSFFVLALAFAFDFGLEAAALEAAAASFFCGGSSSSRQISNNSQQLQY